MIITSSVAIRHFRHFRRLHCLRHMFRSMLRRLGGNKLPGAGMQIESDLHLEFRKRDLPLHKYLPRKSGAQYLVLAGDICPVKKRQEQFSELIAYCAKTWPTTYLVAGNHEYYGATRQETDDLIRGIVASYDNVHFLQRDAVDVTDNITICGCTLWSETLEPLPMNDYTQIRTEHDSPITHYDTMSWHYDDVSWLEETVKTIRDRGRRAIVITHHLPSHQLIVEKFKNDKYNAGFASHLDNLVDQAAVWICGHTHSPQQKTIGGCKVYINPRGYPNETVYRPLVVNIGK